MSSAVIRVLGKRLAGVGGEVTGVGTDHGRVTLSQGPLTGFTSAVVAIWTPDQARARVAAMEDA